jgi:hypothetical protein
MWLFELHLRATTCLTHRTRYQPAMATAILSFHTTGKRLEITARLELSSDGRRAQQVIPQSTLTLHGAVSVCGLDAWQEEHQLILVYSTSSSSHPCQLLLTPSPQPVRD